MAPSCSRAAIRFVATILLVSSVANAVALPHQLLDPRTPLVLRENVAIADVAEAKNDEPKNFWESIGKLLNNNSGWDIFRDFWARLFGARPEDQDNGDENEGDAEETITTTIYVTPTPASSGGIVLPPPVTIPLPAGSETIIFGEPPATPTAAEEGSIFSILPWGDVSTAIEEPIEASTAIEVTLSPVVPVETSAPETSEDLGPAPAVPITDMFSVTIPAELLTTAVAIPETANFSAPAGTGLPLPWTGNASAIVIDVSIVTAPAPIETALPSNETALNTSSIVKAITSIVVVTATVTPGVPLVTEVASASAGTGLPIAISESPVWTNSTAAVVPVVPAVPVGTGTGIVPVIPIIPVGTGSAIAVVPVIPLVTGTGSPAGTGVPVPEIPLFPNITAAGVSAEGSEVPTEVVAPILVTGTPGETLNVTVSLASAPFPNVTEPAVVPSASAGLPIAISEAPLYTNTSSEAEVLPTLTALLGTGSVPSAGIELPVPTETPIYSNTSANATAEIVVVVTPVPIVSQGTGLPIIISAGVSVGINLPAPISQGAPLFPNTTLAVTPELPSETAAPVIDAPPPAESTDAAIEFPGLLALRKICLDSRITVITLPLLDRFYGPNAYPALYPFPGCTGSNTRQSVQAPGLLDCSALGQEVQRCQANGRKVLLSVKGDGVEKVEGNKDFGKSGGLTRREEEEEEGQQEEMKKRQIEGTEGIAGPVVIVEGPLPLTKTKSGTTESPKGIVTEPVTLNGTAPAPAPPPPTTDEFESPPIIDLAFTVPAFPNLFDASHPPSPFALTLFSLFGEGHTERADLRPLGPTPPSPSAPNNTDWINPVLSIIQRPLGEEVVLDGFDIQVPADWKGTYQETQFRALMSKLKELHSEAWDEAGGVVGGKDDLGADGEGVVFFGWKGGMLKVRSPGVEVSATVNRAGWREWNPMIE